MSGEHLRVTFAADGLFDATSAENLPAIDHAVREFDHDCSRDLHAMDLFCGAGNFAREAERRGQKAMAIDIVRDKRNHDITTERGFLYILTGILRIAPRLIRVFFSFEVPFSFIMCGPPCGLYVWMSSSVNKRSFLMPFGDQSLKCIRASNQLVINMIVLLAIAHSRSVFMLRLGFLKSLSNKQVR